MAALVALPALAQVDSKPAPPCPTPLPLPEGRPTPTPTPEATPTPTPTPDCPEEPDPEPTPDEPGDKDPDDKGDDEKQDDEKDDGTSGDNGDGNNGDNDDELARPGYVRLIDSFNTDVLISVAARLRAFGWTTEEFLPKVSPPFIIAGEANGIDTWGAPRFGPGLLVRTHEGQDVFCEYGAPVLAVEDGVVDYGKGGLGGTVARLHRPNGSYWYYAHLSKTNQAEHPSGAEVKTGDVIGFCGNSGNAEATAPHVHFGLYGQDGEARNPMRHLLRFLHRAEIRALTLLARAQGDRIDEIDAITLRRLFGDAFQPDLTEVLVETDALTDAALRLQAEEIARSALEAVLAGEGAGADEAAEETETLSIVDPTD
jgi:murein DD-endopeptidase MepM/ murein hydrolase activator NlpD